jgi:nucleoside-diphosphate-sugar epimerase
MRVLVTGATGVVGRLAIPRLLEQGHRVTAIGRTAEKREQLATLGADAIALDMFDAAAARVALSGHDAVINLATHMPSSTFKMLLPWAWAENDRIRREGSAALVRAALAAGVSRFVQESFAPVYEDGGIQWIDERWPGRTTSATTSRSPAANGWTLSPMRPEFRRPVSCPRGSGQWAAHPSNCSRARSE